MVRRIKLDRKTENSDNNITKNFINKVENNTTKSKVYKSAQKTIKNSKIRYAF